jgi:hypothetical protein
MLGTGHSTGLKQAAASAALLVTITTAGWAFGQPQGGGHPPGSPPEALKACEGKSAGDAVQIQTPHGDTITGTCREMPDGRLAAMPQGGPHGSLPGPPPEAFKACEGKGVGETVQIRTPRGEIITAICRLVAVPQR